MAYLGWGLDPNAYPDKSTWRTASSAPPSQEFAVDPIAGDVRPEDQITVDRVKLDRALQQYRQEQAAALRNMNPTATYGAPGRQTQAPVSLQPVAPTNYNVADRLFGQNQSYMPPTQAVSGGMSQVPPWGEQFGQQRQPSYAATPTSGLPEAPRRDRPFAYNIGAVGASSVEPSPYRNAPLPPAREQVGMSRADLEDLSQNLGIPLDAASTPARPPYDPTKGMFQWNQDVSIRPLPWSANQSIYVEAKPQVTWPLGWR